MDECTAFVCLFTGSKYPVDYVRRLYHSVRRHCRSASPFLCVTDRRALFDDPDIDLTIVPLADALPGWWNKVRLFEPDLTPYRYLIYIDLDVVILKSIDYLLDNVGKAELVYAQDLLDFMSSSFMIIDTASRLAKDVVDNLQMSEWPTTTASDLDPVQHTINDQHYFQRIIQQGDYRTGALNWSDHYSYKYLIDCADWRRRATNEAVAVMGVEQITMLNFHGYPKPHHIAKAPEQWPYSDLILEHWR